MTRKRKCGVLAKAVVFSCAFLMNRDADANALQFFYAESYRNPAQMDQTIGSHLEGGVFIPRIHNRFKGSVFKGTPFAAFGGSGHIEGHQTLFFPYVLFSHRLSSTFVGGVDITNPLLFYTTWPANGFQRNVAIDAILNTYEVAPKLSIRINRKFAIGGSLRYLNLYRTELNYSVFNNYVSNRGTGDGFGGSVGFFLTINPRTFLDMSYFSSIATTLHGRSISGTTVRDNLRVDNFKYAPATFILNFMRIFSKKFLAAVKVMYSYWHPDNRLVLNNVARGITGVHPSVPTIFILNLKNTFNVSVMGRYKTSHKAAITALIGDDQKVVDASTNSLGFPIGNVFFYGAGFEYGFSKTGWLKFFMGQGRASHPSIDNPLQHIKGHWRATYTWADIKATVDF